MIAMESADKISVGKVIYVLALLQILITLMVVGNFVLFNSSLKLWLSQDYFRQEKNDMMLGGDYVLSQKVAELPADANYLVLPKGDIWFINYYLSPRKLFTYQTASQEADLAVIPKQWLRDRQIEYAILYHPPNVRLLKVGAAGSGQGQ